MLKMNLKKPSFRINLMMNKTINFKDIESVQKFVNGKLDDFEEMIDKSTFPKNQSHETSITIKITFVKGVYTVYQLSKTTHKSTERRQIK